MVLYSNFSRKFSEHFRILRKGSKMQLLYAFIHFGLLLLTE